jgi:hypothetical protein
VAALIFYLSIISIIVYILGGFISEGSLEYVGIAAPTSRVYAYSTGIQLIAGKINLWHYAPLEWHDVLRKDREYQ